MASVCFSQPLNPSQQLVINSILKNYEEGQGINRIEGLHTVDFSNIDEDIPSGIVMEHPIEAEMHVDSLPLHSFSFMVICPVIDTENKWTDDHYTSRLSEIQKAIPQYCDAPVSLKTRDCNDGGDQMCWKAELGEDEQSFAGIFKCVRGRETNYYVCAQAGASVACKELRQKLATLESPITFEQLLDDPDYKYCQYVGLRNAERLAYNVARACQVPISHVEDVGAYKEYEYSAYPYRAVPSATQKISSICRLQSGRTVGIFNRVTPIGKAHTTHYVYEGPYHGIAMFNMKGNAKGLGLPAHSGKYDSPKPVRNPKQRAEGLICESIHPADHPDVINQTFCKIDNETFKEQMNALGWKTETIHNLVPVAVKIWDPTIKR